jgi:hypothetical protein
MRRRRRTPRAGTRIAVGLVASAYFAAGAVLWVQSWLHPESAITGVIASAALVALGVETLRLRRWAFRTTIFVCVVALVLAVPACFHPFGLDEVGDPPTVARQVGVFSAFCLVPLTVLTIAALVDKQLR